MADVSIDGEDYEVRGILIARSEIQAFVTAIWGPLAADFNFRRSRTERVEKALSQLFPEMVIDEE